MKVNEFKRVMKRELNFIEITEDWLLFRKPCELYNMVTEETIKFKNLDFALEYELNGKKIADYVANLPDKILLHLEGGRGSANGNQEFRFTSASEGRKGKNGENLAKPLHSASLNVKTGGKHSVDDAIKRFGDKYRNADHEYGGAVDSLGYAYAHVEGGKHSVMIGATGKGDIILHNHPSGGNFSKADMLSVAQTRDRGIVASGKHGDYVFMKTKNFNSNAFVRAVNNARPRGKDYDDAIGKWLKSNQKKYGYTYEFRKLK